MVSGAQCSITVLPGSRFFYRFFFASGPPKPAPEPSPDPPKLPGTAGVLPGPSLGAENRQNLPGQTGGFKIWAEPCASN